jgi:cystathionine beta-lyase/cystathionine gamma-synthase
LSDYASLEYLACLARSLTEEAAEAGVSGLDLALLSGAEPGMSFSESLTAYRRARERVVAALDSTFEVAEPYWSMDEFWADSARQETGASPRAYWDSYENGRRRRLEARLADAFGAPEAILLNAGMSAIDVALRSLRMPPGAPVLIHERAYFETTEIIEKVLGHLVRPVTVDMRDADAISAAIAVSRPAAAIVETVLNGPRCDVPVLEPLFTSGIPLLIDNSALGHGLRWEDLGTGAAGEVVVVESGTKFLTRQASAGVLYGSGTWIREARLCARRVGQQLQGRALHYLRQGEIDHCRQRTRLHATRARQLERQLCDSGMDMRVTSAASAAAGRGDWLARLVSKGANGCMVFVRLGGDPATAERRHRACIQSWAAECSAFPRVRAGFGWTETSGRAYGADPLNTKAGEAFIRLSVGCEPSEEIERIGGIFCKYARETIG